MHMQMDPRDQRLHAATSHFVYGPTTHYSDDLGKDMDTGKAGACPHAPVKIRQARQHSG